METAGDMTELTALMESVNTELGNKKTGVDITKQEERRAAKKGLFADSGYLFSINIVFWFTVTYRHCRSVTVFSCQQKPTRVCV